MKPWVPGRSEGQIGSAKAPRSHQFQSRRGSDKKLEPEEKKCMWWGGNGGGREGGRGGGGGNLASCGHGDGEIKFYIHSCFIAPFTGEQVHGDIKSPSTSENNMLMKRTIAGVTTGDAVKAGQQQVETRGRGKETERWRSGRGVKGQRCRALNSLLIRRFVQTEFVVSLIVRCEHSVNFMCVNKRVSQISQTRKDRRCLRLREL